MSGEDNRDDQTYLADVRRLANTFMRLLDRKKPEKPPAVIEIVPEIRGIAEVPRRPRSRLQILSEGKGRDMRLLSELPDSEVIRLAKRGGRILQSGDVAKVRATAGKAGVVADIIDAMDRNGLFES